MTLFDFALISQFNFQIKMNFIFKGIKTFKNKNTLTHNLK